MQRDRGFVQDMLLQMSVYENRSQNLATDRYILNSTGVISVSVNVINLIGSVTILVYLCCSNEIIV